MTNHTELIAEARVEAGRQTAYLTVQEHRNLLGRLADALEEAEREHAQTAAFEARAVGAMQEVTALFHHFQWLQDGRGPYAYDDHGYDADVRTFMCKLAEMLPQGRWESWETALEKARTADRELAEVRELRDTMERIDANHRVVLRLLTVAERERDAALADNAALRSAIMRCHGADVNGSYFAITPPDAWREVAALLRTDSPGAALLARMERLETRIRIADHIVTRIGRRPAASGDYRGYAWAQAEAELGVLIEQYNAAALDALSESEATG